MTEVNRSGNAQSDGQANGKESRQPDDQGVDLDSDPRFRKWKSLMDRQIAEERQARSGMEQRLNQLQRERDEERMRGMDELEREKFIRTKLESEMQSLRENQQLAYKALLRQQELAKIVAETGIPLEEIQDSESADAAWVAGIRYLKERGRSTATAEQAQSAAHQERREEERPRRANPVDLGSGERVSDKASWDKRYQQLRESGNSVALIEFLRTTPKPT